MCRYVSVIFMFFFEVFPFESLAYKYHVLIITQSVNLGTMGRIADRHVTAMVTCVIHKMENACVILAGRKMTVVQVG